MAYANPARRNLSPSLFEKLFDDEPRTSAEYALPRVSIEDLKDTVARDVETLLNTRVGLSEEQLKAFPEVADSMLSFGMSDFVGRSLANPADRNFICRAIERAITVHESRLQNVRVALDSNTNSPLSLQFTIHASLVFHSAQELVNFDVLLQPTTQQYSVQRPHYAVVL